MKENYIPVHASQLDTKGDMEAIIEARKRLYISDTTRIDWLDADSTRLEDVRGRMSNEEETIREAIDALVALQT